MDETGLTHKFSRLFTLSERLSVVCKDTLMCLRITTDAQEIALYHAVRAHRLLRAIVASVREGYASAAMVLVRSLFNLVVNILWMFREDIDARVERFKDFELLRKRGNALTLIEHGLLPDHVRASYHDFLKVEAEPLLRKCNLKDPRKAREWSRRSILDMAKDLNREPMYHLLYGSLSDVEHTGPHAIAQYLSRDPKWIAVEWGPTCDQAESALLEGMRLFSEAFRELLNSSGVQRSDFEAIANECISEYRSYKDPNKVT